ncbi:hypothetical protein Nans01_39960 [Nocardiopsis ansamitocini]|uniref:Secreted protein n=1 Tax=Nocardiopsis ansamitocini TaxID=1670832 RepID=A0A9W6P8P6_9ACTN|nr:hypothetical protein Nans01_39960 [Nocardiopsis ansamitocini]
MIVENRFALLGLVMVALAALFGAAHLSLNVVAPADAAPVLTRVESALRVCPPPQGSGATQVAAFAPGAEGSDEAGSLGAAPNRPGAEPTEPLLEAGVPWSSTDVAADDEDASGTLVRADGVLAAGLEVTQTSTGGSAVTEVRCVEPSLSTWFVAPGGRDLDELRLHLSNADASAATVNVDLFATDGPAFAPETRGVQIGPADDLELSLMPLVETTGAVAVHVRTNSGRVAAALFAEGSKGGAAWVPATAEPATRHVIPGVVGGGGNKRLIVTAPGDDPATVKVRLTTPDGVVEDESLTSLDVPPAASARLSLEGPLDKRPATVVVESDRPVVAGIAVERSGGDDVAYSSAVDPLESGPNARAVAPATGKGTTSLLLGAPQEAAVVRLTPIDKDGVAGEPVVLTVEAATTVEPELDPTGGGTTWVVEALEGGPVHAARSLAHDGSLSILPLPPAPSEVPLPRVADSLTSIVP